MSQLGMAVSVVNATSDAERELGRSIRRAVFVEEQAVPLEVEVDGLDPECDHFLARLDGVPVATARARSTRSGWKLERVAVLGAHRGQAVGMALVRYMLEQAPPGVTVYVHAQESALGFWERAGFHPRGAAFHEGGIAHRLMEREC